jgi:hypothetical protein
VSRDERSIADRIFDREFDRRDVREALDAMTIDAVCRAIANSRDDGMPLSRRVFAEGQGYWNLGDGRPVLTAGDPPVPVAIDDPAVAQAVGRCAAYQARLKFGTHVPIVIKAHPRPCRFCECRLADLLRVCDWATVTSRYLITERLVWRQFPYAENPAERGAIYERSGLATTYLNEAWASFWAVDPADREAIIAAEMYPEGVTA